MASTAWPSWRKWRISDAATKVLPTSVPVAVMKMALTNAPKNARSHDFGEPLDLGVGMLRGEGKAQPRGAGGHRRRPDGDDQKTFRLQQSRRRERRFGLADDHRHDRRFAPPAG